jgi:hypothetical protein
VRVRLEALPFLLEFQNAQKSKRDIAKLGSELDSGPAIRLQVSIRRLDVSGRIDRCRGV